MVEIVECGTHAVKIFEKIEQVIAELFDGKSDLLFKILPDIVTMITMIPKELEDCAAI